MRVVSHSSTSEYFCTHPSIHPFIHSRCQKVWCIFLLANELCCSICRVRLKTHTDTREVNFIFFRLCACENSADR
jgi:hypothetical protein